MAAQKLGTEIRQEQIVQAAAELVATQGVRQLSVAAVARKVGLVPSALYRHFRGKEEVIDAVLGLLRERIMGNVRIALAESEDPERRLKRLLELHAALVRRNMALPRIIFSDEMYSGRPQRKGRVHAILKGYLREVAAIIRAGQKAGRFRSGQDADTLAVMFVGIVVPAAILWHVSDGEMDVERHAARGWKIFLRALRP